MLFSTPAWIAGLKTELNILLVVKRREVPGNRLIMRKVNYGMLLHKRGVQLIQPIRIALAGEPL